MEHLPTMDYLYQHSYQTQVQLPALRNQFSIQMRASYWRSRSWNMFQRVVASANRTQNRWFAPKFCTFRFRTKSPSSIIFNYCKKSKIEALLIIFFCKNHVFRISRKNWKSRKFWSLSHRFWKPFESFLSFLFFGLSSTSSH